MSTQKQFFVNGNKFYTNVPITLSDLIYYFNYTKSLFVLEYNHSICEKTQWNKIFIADNDKIEIVTIVGGG
jgi:thiamine biosynthesis protein ThiS